jgi:thioredoxin reductase (NADPH)
LRLRIQILGRQWCHLCHEMEAAVAPLAREFGLAVESVDVDLDPELEARWDELVPVLLVEGTHVCHYRLDEAALRARLAALISGAGR